MYGSRSSDRTLLVKYFLLVIHHTSTAKASACYRLHEIKQTCETLTFHNLCLCDWPRLLPYRSTHATIASIFGTLAFLCNPPCRAVSFFPAATFPSTVKSISTTSKSLHMHPVSMTAGTPGREIDRHPSHICARNRTFGHFRVSLGVNVLTI
ncbi:hypothetical protein GGR58DRAFT_342522 [Xylaria digitata]|nr:hypothetical protein GGR58DRAFT_342522 [Xylaria digitata]